MRDWASELRAIADGRLMLNVRNGVTVSRSMLARIADEFEAMSTALAAKDAELEQYLTDRDAELSASFDAGHYRAMSEHATPWRIRAERAEAELAELRQELGETRLVLEQTERNAERIIKMRDAQLVETRKAMNYLNDAVAVGLSDQEVSRRAKLLFAARRALEQGGE